MTALDITGKVAWTKKKIPEGNLDYPREEEWKHGPKSKSDVLPRIVLFLLFLTYTSETPLKPAASFSWLTTSRGPLRNALLSFFYFTVNAHFRAVFLSLLLYLSPSRFLNLSFCLSHTDTHTSQEGPEHQNDGSSCQNR